MDDAAERTGGPDILVPASPARNAGALARYWHGMRSSSPRLNLALQGGGAHGAFTWGVLDALLEAPATQFEGLSGSSAGAINAVLLADGWMKGGRAGAQLALGACRWHWSAIDGGRDDVVHLMGLRAWGGVCAMPHTTHTPVAYTR